MTFVDTQTWMANKEKNEVTYKIGSLIFEIYPLTGLLVLSGWLDEFRASIWTL